MLGAESLESLAAELGAGPLDPLLTRRNVVLRGTEVEALRGEVFTLDCGEGAVVLRGGRPANPCAWLDTVLAPGAHRGLRGRGGIRCAPLADGALRLGPAVLRCAVPLDPSRAGAAVRPAPTRRPRRRATRRRPRAPLVTVRWTAGSPPCASPGSPPSSRPPCSWPRAAAARSRGRPPRRS
ncbi:MOSC domain-containing protein [Blastococcus brunescens]|uniref:MOSC domain-containing protein n=1 Tax=Blastococcus brunescens TaxID=1564165 RepID=A0ABZ1AYE8_9ACTN|nr:MOSC domain-containing protein [Blastococcus sp. BMG 8361]WRL63545.1 MOSC domain-containing protein [Blastococcus sp. BMG 8361]